MSAQCYHLSYAEGLVHSIVATGFEQVRIIFGRRYKVALACRVLITIITFDYNIYQVFDNFE